MYTLKSIFSRKNLHAHFKMHLSAVIYRVIVFLLVFFPLTTSALQKNMAGQQSLQSRAESFSPLSYLMQMTAALVLIGLICYALFWLLKKFSKPGSMQANLIKMVAAYNLNAKDRLVMLNINGQYLLISATPGNVQLIHKFDADFKLNVAESSEYSGEHLFSKYIRHLMSTGPTK